MPRPCHIRLAAIELLKVLALPSHTCEVFSMTRRARGATRPSIMWWSNGNLVAVPPNWENEVSNQTFSPVISDSVWTVVPDATWKSEMRQLAEPPDPDS